MGKGGKRLRSDKRGVWIASVFATLLVLAPLGGPSAQAQPTTRYVDQSNPSCSDAGDGTLVEPFCTISAAAEKAVAGDDVLVSAGTYTEDVSPANSGTSAAPIVFEPNGAAIVTVQGASNGFSISGRSWITVRGFHVADTTSYGISVSGSSHIAIESNRVESAGSPTAELRAFGIKFTETTDSSIAHNTVDHNSDSGIDLVHESTGVVIDGNDLFANAREYTRAAAGMEILSPGNTVINNISHGNEDSGINMRSGGNDTLVANNVVYRNGDHGIDVSKPTGQVIVSNTVYKNTTSGINVEGGGTASIANNISVDNGIDSPRSKGNFRVDSASISGTQLDYDLVYLSSPSTLFVWGGTSYTRLIDFRNATGQETNGLRAGPRFVRVNRDDYHLRPDSRAIDSANSAAAGEQATDADGIDRVDDPATPNTGVGPRPYDDRGAYEFG